MESIQYIIMNSDSYNYNDKNDDNNNDSYNDNYNDNNNE